MTSAMSLNLITNTGTAHRLPTQMLCRLRSAQTIISRRLVFVLSYEKRKRSRNSKKLTEWAAKDNDRQIRREKRELESQLKGLRNLTKKVSHMIEKKDAEQVEASAQKSALTEPTYDNQIASETLLQIAATQSFNPQGNSLATPSVDLPPSIQNKLGVAVKFLVPHHQNWEIVLGQLRLENGFDGVLPVDIRKMIYQIPKKQLRTLFPVLKEMMAEAKVTMSPKILNQYLQSIVIDREIDLKEVEQVVDQIKLTSRKGKLSRDTLEVLIKAYGKAGLVEKMNEVVALMKTQALQPSPKVYSNVLKSCVYTIPDHKQAVKMFDLMKFIAGNMAPKTAEYQDIIVSHINNDEIERALDLYEEMLANKIEPNQEIMVALARGCTSRVPLKAKAWEFMFEIYDRRWTPKLPTLGYMLYLAAKDGDLALSRALYLLLSKVNATSPRTFSFLLMAYSRYLTGDSNQLLAITASETGRNFRRNMLQQTEYSDSSIPFLPRIINTPEEILAETSALMAYVLQNSPSHVNIESVNTFLSVAAHSLLRDFVDRYEQFTYLDRRGISLKSEVEVLTPDILDEFMEDEKKVEEHNFTKSPILRQAPGCKVGRSTVTYIVALKAAAKGGNYSFAQSIWTERGEFRKSESFRSLSKSQREKEDFAFASEMVASLTTLKLLDDALAILVSTEYQFRWTWKELRGLYEAAIGVGHQKVAHTVRGVVSRAQVHFEGKINKSDYRRYVAERGY